MKYKCIHCGREKYIPAVHALPKNGCPVCGGALIWTRYCQFCKIHSYDLAHNTKCATAHMNQKR